MSSSDPSVHGRPAFFSGFQMPWDAAARDLEAAPPAPSTQRGLGRMEVVGVSAFRVWAPFADSVAVAGTWNSESCTADPLAPEGNGYWSADVPGPKPGDIYKFVIHKGDQDIWRTNPYAREIHRSEGGVPGYALVHDPDFDWTGDNFTMSPWNELVIYEMHIGTFNDQAQGEPGTFDNVIERLPYLRDLGINAIEIMPVAEFPMSYSWGYNPAYPFAVETALGGPQGLCRFIKAAHMNGIAVILDVVYNHFGPGDLDLWRFDGWSSDDHNGGIYFYDNRRASTPWGDTRPDYGRPEVRQYIRDNAQQWLKKYRVDGLRFDATAYIRNIFGNNDDGGNGLPDGWTLLQAINDDIDSSQPWKLTIGEDLRGNEWITRDTGAGGAGFDAQWAGEFVHPIRQAVITPNDGDRDMGSVAEAIRHRYGGDAFHRVIYTESHDEVANGHQRVPSEIWNDNPDSWYSKKRSTLGAAAVLTAPGIPMLFQGQEFLECGWFSDQTPLDWSKLEKYAGINRLYSDLMKLRRDWHNNTAGLRGQNVNVHHVNHDGKVVAYHRWQDGGPGDDVIVLLNFGNTSYSDYVFGFPRSGPWHVRFNSDWNGYDESFGDWNSLDTWAQEGEEDGMPYHGAVGLGPYSAVILSQDR
jgi:1,4-alpha-glucan branching enzyme